MGEGARVEGGAEAIGRVLFVLWHFPELSQTFIHREMVEMERLGARVQVLGVRLPGSPEARRPELRPIVERALFLPPPALWAPRAAAFARRHPARFGRTVSWMATRRHRGPVFRARALAMVLAAASVAEEVEARGVRYVQAHFGAYQAELALALAMLLDLPYGLTLHAYGIYRDRNILHEKVGQARSVLTCTAYNLRHLQRIFPAHADRIHLVHHGIDLDRIPQAGPPPGEGPTRWLAVGRLVAQKGFDVLVRAAARLRDRGVSFEVTILGDGEERKALAALIAHLGVGAHVKLAGAVPNDEVLRRLRGSHGFVMPSVRVRNGDVDGIPNVVLEAMAMERAVVASEISGLPEVVVPGETGLLVPSGDVAALAEAMERAAADRAELARLGRGGRALVESRFDVRTNARIQVDHLLRAMGS